MNLNPWNWKSWIRICRMETHYLYLVYIYANWRTFLIFVWQSTSVFCIQCKGHLNSEWIYEDIDCQKQQRKYWKDICPESFHRHNLADQLTLFKPAGGRQIITQRITVFLTLGFKKLSTTLYLFNKDWSGQKSLQNFCCYFGKSMPS